MLHSTNGPKARPAANSRSWRHGAALDLEPVASLPSVDTVSVLHAGYRTAWWFSRAGNVGIILECAEDDAAIMPQASRHVDYLSHNWKEEEYWASWKYIVSERPRDNNSRRLENALWRTWMKTTEKLETVHPRTINWCAELVNSFVGEIPELILSSSG
jgi:hypothetical protein